MLFDVSAYPCFGDVVPELVGHQQRDRDGARIVMNSLIRALRGGPSELADGLLVQPLPPFGALRIEIRERDEWRERRHVVRERRRFKALDRVVVEGEPLEVTAPVVRLM